MTCEQVHPEHESEIELVDANFQKVFNHNERSRSSAQAATIKGIQWMQQEREDKWKSL